MLVNAATLNSVALNSFPDATLRIRTAQEIVLAELIETGGRYPLRHRRSLEYFLKNSLGKPLPQEMQSYFLALVQGLVNPRRGRPKDMSLDARDKLVLKLYPEYLSAAQAEAQRQPTGSKQSLSKSDREQNAPHQRAAQVLAQDLRKLGFASISAAHIRNLGSSQKRR